MQAFFSLVNKVITCMELYTRVKVEFPPRNTLFGGAHADVWSVMFRSLQEPLAKDEPFDEIREYPHPTYTHKNAAHCYGRRDGWRFRLHRQLATLSLRPEIAELAAGIFPGEISECVGLLYRGEKELAREQRSGVLPSPEEMCAAALRAAPAQASIFVCADSVEANERCRVILGERMLFWEQGDKCRLVGEAVHRGSGFGSDNIRKSLAMVMALSKTRHFVHAVSNMATAVLYFNPWLPHTFVETEAA